MKTPILGSAYVARSINAADNRMVNLFPEIIPEGGKEPAFLSRTPGLRLYRTVGNGPVRGMCSFGGSLYVVSGQELYKVNQEPVTVTTPGYWSNGPDDCGIASVADISGSSIIDLTVGGRSYGSSLAFGDGAVSISDADTGTPLPYGQYALRMKSNDGTSSAFRLWDINDPLKHIYIVWNTGAAPAGSYFTCNGVVVNEPNGWFSFDVSTWADGAYVTELYLSGGVLQSSNTIYVFNGKAFNFVGDVTHTNATSPETLVLSTNDDPPVFNGPTATFVDFQGRKLSLTFSGNFNVPNNTDIMFTVKPTYRFTIGAETWPAIFSDWETVIGGTSHSFTLATLSFNASAPTTVAGTYYNSLVGPTVESYSTLVGTVVGTGPVSISGGMVGSADNSVPMVFVAAEGAGYLYDTLTNEFSQITDEGFLGSTVVGNLDGHFIFVTSEGLLQFSQGSNPVTFDALDIQDVYPDKIVSLIIDHREIWVFGSNSVSVWYNDGSADFLARIQGAFNEIGCAAPFSIAKLDNGIFWLGQDARGQGIVYRSNGYSGQRISTHAIEWQIQQYGDLSDAIAYTYQQDGHSFYVLTFPSSDATWVYDVATQAWHERAGFVDGAFTRHRSNCQAFYGNEVIVGDCENGNLYAFDLNVFDDNGAIQKWLRSWRVIPPGQNDLKRTTHHSLQLDCETGVGADGGNNPQAMLRWSDDGGHSWSNEHWASLGTLGQYGRRVIWRRLGMTTKLRDRVYEVSGTDPAKIVISGAELLIGTTNA